MGTVRKVRSPGGEEMILMSPEDYEDLLDSRAAAEARAALAEDGETLSSEEVKEALASPTLLAFWRRKRGVSQHKLAEALGTPEVYVSDVENGWRIEGIGFYERAAEILRVRPSDIMPDDAKVQERTEVSATSGLGRN